MSEQALMGENVCVSEDSYRARSMLAAKKVNVRHLALGFVKSPSTVDKLIENAGKLCP